MQISAWSNYSLYAILFYCDRWSDNIIQNTIFRNWIQLITLVDFQSTGNNPIACTNYKNPNNKYNNIV